MLQLPIRRRELLDLCRNSNSQDEACKAGRQVLWEALNGDRFQSLSDTVGLKLTVKNTFIDLEPARHWVEQHRSGAQTCLARLSGSTPEVFFGGDFMLDDDIMPDTPSDALGAQELGAAMTDEHHILTSLQLASLGEPNTRARMQHRHKERMQDLIPSERRRIEELKLPVKNTFIDFASEQLGVENRGVQSALACMSGSDVAFFNTENGTDPESVSNSGTVVTPPLIAPTLGEAQARVKVANEPDLMVDASPAAGDEEVGHDTPSYAETDSDAHTIALGAQELSAAIGYEQYILTSPPLSAVGESNIRTRLQHRHKSRVEVVITSEKRMIEELKPPVKNTFIDLAPEQSGIGYRGVQSALAPLSGSEVAFFNTENRTDPESVSNLGTVAAPPLIEPTLGEALARARVATEPMLGEVQATVKNTFIEFEVVQPGSVDEEMYTRSCPVGPIMPPSRCGAPTIQTVGVADDMSLVPSVSSKTATEEILPPPAVPAVTCEDLANGVTKAFVGRQVLLEALSHNALATTPFAPGMKLVVRNTFIDVASDTTMVDHRGSQTCIAKLHGSAPATFGFPRTPTELTRAVSLPACAVDLPGCYPPSPTSPLPTLGAAISFPANSEMQTSNGRWGQAFIAERPLRSVGSRLHGIVSLEGSPVCKPCAWYQKNMSCLNGASCGYCHLCPPGELKKRKKEKIARLRGSQKVALQQSAGT